MEQAVVSSEAFTLQSGPDLKGKSETFSSDSGDWSVQWFSSDHHQQETLWYEQQKLSE